jgi:hypothetical protein
MKTSEVFQFLAIVYSIISQTEKKTRALYYICVESYGPQKKTLFCRRAAILIAPTKEMTPNRTISPAKKTMKGPKAFGNAQ